MIFIVIALCLSSVWMDSALGAKTTGGLSEKESKGVGTKLAPFVLGEAFDPPEETYDDPGTAAKVPIFFVFKFLCEK